MTQLLSVLLCGDESGKIYMCLNVCSSDFGINRFSYFVMCLNLKVLAFDSYFELQVNS